MWFNFGLDNLQNTINTLKYACKAKKIKNNLKAGVKQDEEMCKQIVSDMKDEIEQLKVEIEEVKAQNFLIHRSNIRDR